MFATTASRLSQVVAHTVNGVSAEKNVQLAAGRAFVVVRGPVTNEKYGSSRRDTAAVILSSAGPYSGYK